MASRSRLTTWAWAACSFPSRRPIASDCATRDGRKAGEGSAAVWMVEVNVRMGDLKEMLMPVTVTDAKRFFSAAQQELERAPGLRRPP